MRELELITSRLKHSGIYNLKKYTLNSDEGFDLFFTKGCKVIQILIIEADCGQNMGYVSEVKFSSPGGE